MRDPWIRAHFGPETTPRSGLLDELADDLATIWQPGTPQPTQVQTRIHPRLDTAYGQARKPEPQPLARRELAPTHQPASWRRPAVIASVALVMAGLTAIALSDRNNTATSETTPTNTPTPTVLGQTTPAEVDVPVASTDTTGAPAAANTVTQPSIDGSPRLGGSLFSPACTEIAPTTQRTIVGPTFEELEPLAAGPALDITLPVAADTGQEPYVKVSPFPGGVLVWANAVPEIDGEYRDTMIAAVGNDGTIWWRHCYAEYVDLWGPQPATGAVTAHVVFGPMTGQETIRSISIADGAIGNTVASDEARNFTLSENSRIDFSARSGTEVVYSFKPLPEDPNGYATLVATDNAGNELWRNNSVVDLDSHPGTPFLTYFTGDRVLAFGCTQPDPWPDNTSPRSPADPSCGFGVTAVDPDTGATVWKRTSLGQVPAISDRQMIVDDGDRFVMISTQTGEAVSDQSWPRDAFRYISEGLDGYILWTAELNGVVVHVDGARATVWYPASAGLSSRTVDLR